MYNYCVPEYRYECVDRSGKPLKGVVHAESREGAVIAIRNQGLIPTGVCELREKRPQYAPGFGGVSVQRLAAYTRKFAELSRTDIPMSEVFEILGEEEEGRLLPEASRYVAREIGTGRQLGQAMSQCPRVFSKLYIRMVEAGIRSGTLDRVADNLARLFETENALRKNLVSKLIYPALLLAFSFLVALILHSVRLGERRIISDGLFYMLMWFWMMIGLLGLFGITRPGYAIYRQIGFRLPWIGALMRNINLARFCRIFGLQYAAGVPIVEGLETSKEVLQDPLLERAVTGIQKRINAGMDLRDAMIATRIFPGMMVSMIGTGERAGGVDKMLEKLAEYYELDVNTQSTIMATVLIFVVMLAVLITGGAIVIGAWSSHFAMINDVIEGRF